MKEFSKVLCKAGAFAFVWGASYSIGIGVLESICDKIRFKRDMKQINKLLDEMDKLNKAGKLHKRKNLFGRK